MGPAGRDRVGNQAGRLGVVRDSDDLRRGSPGSNMLRPVVIGLEPRNGVVACRCGLQRL